MSEWPAAWLGMRSEGLARVCAYCPDKALADDLAALEGLAVSHGACERCAAEQLAILDAVAVPFVPLAELARVCGLTEEQLAKPWPRDLRVGRDWRNDQGQFEVARHAVGSFVGVLSTTGRSEAALALWRWLLPPDELIAGGQAMSGAEDVKPTAPPRPANWVQQWEETHT